MLEITQLAKFMKIWATDTASKKNDGRYYICSVDRLLWDINKKTFIAIDLELDKARVILVYCDIFAR